MMDALTSVTLSNAIGISLMLVLIFSNPINMLKERDMKPITIMSVLAMISCATDVLAYYVDGQEGALARFLIYAFNTWLYFSNMVMLYLWAEFMTSHIGAPVTRARKTLYLALLSIGIMCSVINLFYPIAFSVTDNVYKREAFYWVYVAIGGFFMADSIVIYISTKRKGGFLISFPILAFMLPVVTGITVQSMFYGISVMWVGVTIAIAGMLISLKNEMIYLDQLTGIYNRYYLEWVKAGLLKRNDTRLTGIMIDLNDFKSINDRFGHSVGDEALVIVSDILVRSLKGYGKVIRYAGDEFVVLINTTDQAHIERVVADINKGFSEFNDSKKKPYLLSASMGYHVLNLKEQTIDEFISTVDARMYSNKVEYYKTHVKGKY